MAELNAEKFLKITDFFGIKVNFAIALGQETKKAIGNQSL